MIIKKGIFLFLIVFVSISIFSQQKIKLWNGNNVTEKEKRSELTVFLSEKPDTSGISVIICPGGSYYWLAMRKEGFSVAKYLNKQGITAFVLKYRTAKYGYHYPAMLQDLERAMYLVKQNAKEYKINPEKVGVMGFSAGGHLAGTAAIYFDNRFEIPDMRYATKDSLTSHISHRISQNLKPYFAAMIYPVVSMEDSICHKKSRSNLLGEDFSNELKQKLSLEKNVHAGMPPVFLLHCIDDKTVDYHNSVFFDQALTANNVQHKFLLIDKCGHGGHGFGIQSNGKATGWIDEFITWLSKL